MTGHAFTLVFLGGMVFMLLAFALGFAVGQATEQADQRQRDADQLDEAATQAVVMQRSEWLA